MERKEKEERENNSCSQFKKTNYSNKFTPNPHPPPPFSCSELLLWVKLVVPNPLTGQKKTLCQVHTLILGLGERSA